MMRSVPQQKPSWGLGLFVCGLAAAAYIYLRLYLFSDQLVPLTFALPLLLGLWHRSRVLNCLQIAFYCGLALLNVLRVDTTVSFEGGIWPFVMMLANIITVGIVIDQLMLSRQRLLDSNHDLQQANEELETSNEELAARDEEITSQNEELQQQTEELEQQSTELHQQTEELQQQTEELQLLQDESATRAQLLQALLDATTTNLPDAGAKPLDGICAAAVQAFGHDAEGARLYQQADGRFAVQGQSGTALQSDLNNHAPWTKAVDTFVELVAREGRTACVEDLAQVSDQQNGAAANGPRSVLASPLRLDGHVIGILAIFGNQPRRWTEAEFRIVHWFATQAALVLRTIQLQDELDGRSRQAEENSRQKTRFLAAVSHDVRNPANAINLMAELIHRSGQDPRLMAEIPRLAEGLRSNAKLLVELVSDVLDLSRFDSGKIDLDEAVFDPAELIRAEVGQYDSLANNAGLKLTVNAESDQCHIKTDRMKLARVLANLVGNAIKFTEVGTVRASLQRLDDGALEIAVADSGVGIAPEHIEHIFDEFYQIRNPERDRSKGTGLGLAICKRLIDAIGCSLGVHSEVGRGTTFTLRLPAEMVVEADCEPVALAASSAAEDDHLLAGLNVLVVEDHETTRHAVTQLLAVHGATVDPAEDGRAALRHLRHQKHDVVLLDLMLPDMDGREILQHLREHRPQRLKCILAVSGDVSEARRQELEMLGASGLVPKPVQIDHLVRRIVESMADSQAPSSRDDC
jgi:signal transduction histidine kinase/ActR/RegA family two-component response regulator